MTDGSVVEQGRNWLGWRRAFSLYRAKWAVGRHPAFSWRVHASRCCFVNGELGIKFGPGGSRGGGDISIVAPCSQACQ